MRTSITSSTSGSQRFDVFSSSATLAPGQNAIATTSAITLTLPAATTTRSTRIANTSGAAITVSGGSSTINGASTLSLDSGAIGEFYPQAGAWVAIGGAINASRIITGKLSVDRIGATGTPSSTTYYRGDDTWATIESGVTVQANPPTATTNAALGSLVYATSNSRIYACVDATTNANAWSYWNRDGVERAIERHHPGGTLVDDLGANHASNTTIANADILWYIGTNGLTTAYTNPIDGTKIIQTNSGIYSSYSSPVVLADRQYGSTIALTYCSPNVSQSWFRLNFGASTRISLTKIALQQNAVSSECFRTISVRYSSDGSSFTQAVSSTASNGLGDWHVFDVTNFPASQHLEITQTSLNSASSNLFLAGELLLYGTISLI